MVIAAATLFAVNGAVSKLALDGERDRDGALDGAALDGRLPRPRARPRGARPGRLRIGTRRELGRLAFYGIVGFALVQWLYFVAITGCRSGSACSSSSPPRSSSRCGRGSPGTSRCAAASGRPSRSSSPGSGSWRRSGTGSRSTASASPPGLLAACALAVFYLMGERLVGRRDPISVTCFGLGFASLAWAVVAPWWSFPTAELGSLGRAAARARRRPGRRARALGDRARDDRAVHALDLGTAASAGDDGRDRRHLRAGRRRRDRLGVARRGPRGGADPGRRRRPRGDPARRDVAVGRSDRPAEAGHHYP